MTPADIRREAFEEAAQYADVAAKYAHGCALDCGLSQDYSGRTIHEEKRAFAEEIALRIRTAATQIKDEPQGSAEKESRSEQVESTLVSVGNAGEAKTIPEPASPAGPSAVEEVKDVIINLLTWSTSPMFPTVAEDCKAGAVMLGRHAEELDRLRQRLAKAEGLLRTNQRLFAHYAAEFSHPNFTDRYGDANRCKQAVNEIERFLNDH